MPDDRTGRVSVVIPCHSQMRWPSLVAAVESVLAQDPRPAELVVSVDHNDELLQRVRQRWPQITVLANRFPGGASGNRNTGVLHTRTPLIALLDDDACARPGWLGGMLDPFDDPSVIGSGGAIVPRWAPRRPAWFPDELLWAVAGTPDHGPATVTVRNVWSASMVVRRDVFDAVGGFRVGFGKRGNRPRPEDTDLCLRMSRVAGGRWTHVPYAVVDHLISAERLTLRSVLARCYHEGRGKVELARAFGDTAVLDVERQYLRHTVSAALRKGLTAPVGGRGVMPAARVGVLLAGMMAAAGGAAVESIHLRRAYPDLSGRSIAAISPFFGPSRPPVIADAWGTADPADAADLVDQGGSALAAARRRPAARHR